MTETKETAIVQRREDSLVPDAHNMGIIAEKLLKSGMWPQFKSEAQVFAAIEYGRELGLAPVMSLQTIFPVNGRLSMVAQAMLAIANQRSGVTWKVDSSTKAGCTMTFMRPGFEPIKVTFDEADAKAAGLLGKDNWRNYPKAMYLSKAGSMGVRQIAPDAVLGLYSKDELEDLAPDIMPAAGEVVEAGKETKTETGPVATVVHEPEPEAEQKRGPGRPKKEIAKAEPEQTNPVPEPTGLDKIKGEIILTLKALVEKFGRDPGDLLERIKGRVMSVFGVERERIPEDLEEKEAVVVRNALRNSIEAEEAELAKEKEL